MDIPKSHPATDNGRISISSGTKFNWGLSPLRLQSMLGRDEFLTIIGEDGKMSGLKIYRIEETHTFSYTYFNNINYILDTNKYSTYYDVLYLYSKTIINI